MTLCEKPVNTTSKFTSLSSSITFIFCLISLLNHCLFSFILLISLTWFLSHSSLVVSISFVSLDILNSNVAISRPCYCFCLHLLFQWSSPNSVILFIIKSCSLDDSTLVIVYIKIRELTDGCCNDNIYISKPMRSYFRTNNNNRQLFL